MDFRFHAPAAIRFGPGTAREIPSLAAALRPASASGHTGRVCLVTGASPRRHAAIHDALAEQGLDPLCIAVPGEPGADAAQQWAAQAREAGCSVVVAVGGGSAMDAGKAVAALLTNAGDIYEHLEVVGRGRPLVNRPASLVLAPTTAGTGSEATMNAVLTAEEHGVKVSLRSPAMLADAAVVDPELTHGMPPAVTASTGMDALTQLVEALVSAKATPMTRALCREGLPRAARALPRAYRKGTDAEARQDMALAALLSGLALANGGLGAVHGFAAPLGAALGAAHGSICAALLPVVMEANIRALRESDPEGPALAAYAEAAALLTGDADAIPEDGAVFCARLARSLDIPGLGSLGMALTHVTDLAAKASRASSMRGNPVALDESTLADILEAAL